MKKEMKELCITGGKVAFLGAAYITGVNIAESIYKHITYKRNIKQCKKILKDLDEMNNIAQEATKKKRFIFKRK